MEDKNTKRFNRWYLVGIGAVIGAAAGYAYWYFIGCDEGCSIRSSWWKMSVYGAFMGGLVLDMFNPNSKKKQAES